MEKEWLEETNKERRFSRAILIAGLCLTLLAAVLFLMRCESEYVAALPTPVPESVPNVDADDFTGLRVWFIDVGQGDCTLLLSPSGKTMLIDAGLPDSFAAIRGTLDLLGITRIDLAVCTHFHADHIGGMAEVLDHYEVGSMVVSPYDIDSSLYAALVEQLDRRGVPAASVYAGADTTIPWDESCTVRVLSPFEVRYDDENDTSLMLHVSYGLTSVLLPADATELSERLAVKAFPNRYLHANVLKVGHHGSQTSSSKKFLSAVKPEIAVISCGKGNEYGLPDELVLNRLIAANAKILRTDTDGTVLIALDGTRAWVVE